MRFIGNKENLLDRLFYALQQHGVVGKSFFDFFAGTASVARFFKRLNYRVHSSDLLYFSYCLQYAYIKNNTEPSFEKVISTLANKSNYIINSPLDDVLAYLNQVPPVAGFIYQNYSVGGTSHLPQARMYFSDGNAQKIDAIRTQIEGWRIANLLTEAEYFILLACLIESVSFFSNVAGVYAAFQKKWDKRALRPFVLKPIELIFNSENNEVFNANSTNLVHNIDVDVLYLDPPYNERQYAPNYHLIETIARYDNPAIHGVTGMRNYNGQKSAFCNKNTAIKELDYIAKNAKYKYLLLSYNSEGIMSQAEIAQTLSKYGQVELIEFDYARFKSNNNGTSGTKKRIKELLYVCRYTIN
ncbi:DNA adenine methylase [Deferribacterales bacterium RsTz2092]|nr:restriction endonuclease subunit M [Deferribacterales bacterium]